MESDTSGSKIPFDYLLLAPMKYDITIAWRTFLMKL